MKGNLAGPRLLKVDQLVVRCLLDEAKEVYRARDSEGVIKDSKSRKKPFRSCHHPLSSIAP